MFIFAKTIKNHEYIYSNKTAVLCRDKKQAQAVADFLNANNATNRGDFKLKDNEIYHVYEIDKYDKCPPYRLKTTRGKIFVRDNI